MPKGQPKAGFRKTKAWQERNGVRLPSIDVNRPEAKIIQFSSSVTSRVQANEKTTFPSPRESEDVIRARIAERFSVLEYLTHEAINGEVRALIVSGPTGVGKSFTVEERLNLADCPHKIVKGYVKATGLYKALYEMRHPGNVVVFDDADSVFEDMVALNLLKAACDTTAVRKLSYLSEASLVGDDGLRVEREFEFHGTIIFISNTDFDTVIDKGGKLGPHLSAIISRAHYVSLAMHCDDDVFIRIKDMLRGGMVKGISREQIEDVIAFMTENLPFMRELSLRTAIKLGTLVRSGDKNWQAIARITQCRTTRRV